MWRRGEYYYGYVFLDERRRRQVSLGTADKKIASGIERVLAELREQRRWPLLVAAHSATPFTVGDIFDAYRTEGKAAFDRLEASLNDVDLNGFVTGWQAWAAKHATPDSVKRYLQQLRALVPEGQPFPRSGFTRSKISKALTALPGSGSTGRRYHAAWSSFARYLVELEVLEHNPLRDIRAPGENPPRELWLPLAEQRRLADAQPEPFRTLAALLQGGGVEISAALRVRRRDVSDGAAVVQVHGTKTPWRNRPVNVEPWARPYLLRQCGSLLPDAVLFDGVDYDDVRKQHRAALRRLYPDKADARRGLTLHDSRHSHAVLRMQRGDDPNDIARNLGHSNAVLLLRIYGKHRGCSFDCSEVVAQA